MGVHGDYLRGASRMAGVGALTGALAGAWSSSRGGQRGAQRGQRGQRAQRGLFSMAAGGTPLNMLVSQQKKISYGRLCAISLGLFTLLVGIILSSVPWLDYMIQKDLKLRNDTMSYYYWQKPGVVRLTKVYIFNVTNADGVLRRGERPRLQEVGPYVYREEMEKVNVQFHDNDTVTFQHRKILHFVPEMSRSMTERICVPNIPLLTLATQSRHMPWGVQAAMSVLVRGMENFVMVTPEQFLFGYDDALVTLANIANTLLHINWPAPRIMSLLKGRNGTLPEVHTMYTGHTSMARMGLLDRLNGLDHLPFWSEPPCNSIKASEGSFFPPRDITHEDLVAIYDKDLCRAFPLQWRRFVDKDGISAGYYTPPDSIFAPSEAFPDNKCFCNPGESPTAPCELKGLQNISPCHYDAPVFVSFPHFFNADSSLLEAVEGMSPNRDRHETFFKIQTKLGVTMEAKVRIQLNLKVDHPPYIYSVHTFPEIVFPIIWLEEGVDELTPEIHRWVYIATTAADFIIPSVEYSFIVVGALTLAAVFVRTYKGVVFTAENLERGMEELRTGSHLIINAASHAAHAATHPSHARHKDREQQYHLLRSTSSTSASSTTTASSSTTASTPLPSDTSDQVDLANESDPMMVHGLRGSPRLARAV